MMIAQVTWLKVWEFVHFIGDAHIYSNQIEQVTEQISRSPRPIPTMKLNPDIMDIDAFTYEDFTLEWYDPHGTLKGEVVNIGGF